MYTDDETTKPDNHKAYTLCATETSSVQYGGNLSKRYAVCVCPSHALQTIKSVDKQKGRFT